MYVCTHACARKLQGVARDKAKFNDDELLIVDAFNAKAYPLDSDAKRAIDVKARGVVMAREGVLCALDVCCCTAAHMYAYFFSVTGIMMQSKISHAQPTNTAPLSTNAKHRSSSSPAPVTKSTSRASTRRSPRRPRAAAETAAAAMWAAAVAMVAVAMAAAVVKAAAVVAAVVLIS